MMAAADTTVEKAETDDERRARIKKEVTSEIPANREEAPELTACIERANDALEQKAKVLAVIQECRQYGTSTVNMGRGDREQVEWLRFYLPRKKRKNSTEPDATDDGE